MNGMKLQKQKGAGGVNTTQSTRCCSVRMSIINVLLCRVEIKKKSHSLMNMISLTSRSQSNEINLGECSIRTMKSALQTLCCDAWIKRTPTHIAGSLDYSLDCFLIKQEGGGTSGLSNNFHVFFFSISACHHLDYKKEGKKTVEH